jgi:transposase
VELFEQILREYEHGVGTIKGVARKFGMHRRMVRDAIANADSPPRKAVPRERPKVGAAVAFIDERYEAWVELGEEKQQLYVFCMRSMASGGSFHRAYPHASQQAFLEAQELAFQHFGGVFELLRFDNLKSAVQKILRGHQREETQRFIAFRSHCGFQCEFCT